MQSKTRNNYYDNREREEEKHREEQWRHGEEMTRL